MTRRLLGLVVLLCGGVLVAGPPSAELIALAGLERLALGRHPRLAQAELAIEQARGRALQAGLYPNPVFTFYGDELGDRTGPSGILQPFFTQEILTAKKMPLDKAAAGKEVDQAALAAATARFALLVAVRHAYFELLAVQARIEVFTEAVQIGEESVRNAEKLVAANQLTPFDRGLIEIELEKSRADLAAAQAELVPSWRRLAAAVGADPGAPVSGALDGRLPDYELERSRAITLAVSPELQSARVGVDKFRLQLARAEAQACPNVTVGGSYVWQGQNRSNDVSVQLGFPVPVFNRNQGNVRAAQAALADAGQEVSRVELDLADRVAAAFRDYAVGRARAERYRNHLLPRAIAVYDLGKRARQAGELDLFKSLESFRALQEVRQETIRSLTEAWKAAATLSGLMLEEPWPVTGR